MNVQGKGVDIAVLVTGAAGLIGSAVCRHLSQTAVPFTAVWNTVEPDAASTLRADLTRADALAGIEGVTAVVHAAAALPMSFADSDAVGQINRQIDDLMLSRAQRWEVPVVYVSGTSIYRPAGEKLLDEAAAVAPVGRYLEEKARTEELGLRQAEQTGRPFTSLRVSAPYGFGQRSRTVVVHFVDAARRGEPLQYYGTGSREQDFTWADDVGTAAGLALDGPGGVFNIATGEPVRMRQLAETVAVAAGLPLTTVRPAGRPDPQEGSKVRLDVRAAARDLGWTATTPLSEGVARLLRGPR